MKKRAPVPAPPVRWSDDALSGLAAMLVALPSSIAFGLIIFAPLGAGYAGKAALAGMIGAVCLGIVAALLGGAPRLITAPCAPAAAVLSVFVAGLTAKAFPVEAVPLLVTLVALSAGIAQMIAGQFGGGRFIKYIPYPVVAGYLSGVGLLILIGQLPKFLGLPADMPLWEGVMRPEAWNGSSAAVGLATVTGMILAPRFFRTVPAVLLALLAGVGTYFILAVFRPELYTLTGNPLIIGPISASWQDMAGAVADRWRYASWIDPSILFASIVPILTLAILLSIDTLKTCVVLDSLTASRHEANRELRGQGAANLVSALAGGIAGSGTMGPTLVNVASGAKSHLSGIFAGVFAALTLILLGRLMAWIPLAALAGVLMVVGVRMIDAHSVHLLRNRATVFDFLVILAVVVSAVSMSLIMAAGVGTALAIVLFLREQIRFSVVRRKFFGNQKFSKKKRVSAEMALLEAEGKETLVCELQGQLFFGTTDQLFTELEPYFNRSRFLVLDMRRVQSLDFTAANMLKQIHNRIKARGGYLVLASIPLTLPTGQNVKEYLETLGFSETGMNLRFFPDLDSALEWVEDEILKLRAADAAREVALPLREFEFFSGEAAEGVAALAGAMTEKTLAPGEKIFAMGEKEDAMYFIRKGDIKILLPLEGGKTHHLATFSRGDFFGELSFLDRGARSAEAVAVGEVLLAVLSREAFDAVGRTYPAMAAVFFERMAYVVSRRLRLTNVELMALEE